MTGIKTIQPDSFDMDDTPLLKTPLHHIHLRLGAKMAPFAGYEMPIQYPAGTIAEHQHTRNASGLFDVSHMGVVEIKGDQATECLEQLIPCDLKEMKVGQISYGILSLETGGIVDDLLITRKEDGFLLVINASRKMIDIAYISKHLHSNVLMNVWNNYVMIALQGPESARILSKIYPDISEMSFMTGRSFGPAWISRSGYTGEDGFEILVPAHEGILLTEQLLQLKEVLPIGLAARDSLRLEAGLCLYGHELEEDVTPVEAKISWLIGKRRRQDGGFLGAPRVLDQLQNGFSRARIGLTLTPGGIPREGAEIQSQSGDHIGIVSSGGFSPLLGHPIAMGYVNKEYALQGTTVMIQVRGQLREAQVVSLPFVPHRYFKKQKEK